MNLIPRGWTVCARSLYPTLSELLDLPKECPPGCMADGFHLFPLLALRPLSSAYRLPRVADCLRRQRLRIRRAPAPDGCLRRGLGGPLEGRRERRRSCCPPGRSLSRCASPRHARERQIVPAPPTLSLGMCMQILVRFTLSAGKQFDGS